MDDPFILRLPRHLSHLTVSEIRETGRVIERAWGGVYPALLPGEATSVTECVATGSDFEVEGAGGTRYEVVLGGKSYGATLKTLKTVVEIQGMDEESGVASRVVNEGQARSVLVVDGCPIPDGDGLTGPMQVDLVKKFGDVATRMREVGGDTRTAQDLLVTTLRRLQEQRPKASAKKDGGVVVREMEFTYPSVANAEPWMRDTTVIDRGEDEFVANTVKALDLTR